MTQEKETPSSLKEEIYEAINICCNGQHSLERRYEITDYILKLIEKHGYRKTKVLSGFWSD